MIFSSINPYNLETVAEYAALSDTQIQQKLDTAATAFKSWKKTSFAQRAELMHRVANILRRDKEALATLITTEMGKIIAESRAEIEKTAGHVAFFADNTEGYLKDEIIPYDPQKAMVAFDPIGCIFAVMPWNFPFWQVLRYSVFQIIVIFIKQLNFMRYLQTAKVFVILISKFPPNKKLTKLSTRILHH